MSESESPLESSPESRPEPSGSAKRTALTVVAAGLVGMAGAAVYSLAAGHDSPSSTAQVTQTPGSATPQSQAAQPQLQPQTQNQQTQTQQSQQSQPQPQQRGPRGGQTGAPGANTRSGGS